MNKLTWFTRRLARSGLFLWFVGLAACGSSPEVAPGAGTRLATPTPTPEIGITFVTLAPPTAAVIQTTPTPLPTATPTPTPTPIVYVIEEGDTLLAIAIERYTTVDEITALNPGLVPELLQIGQQVILPPPATPVFQAGISTPIPIQVEVVNLSLYRTPVGSLWLLGEVLNRGAYPAENVQVEVTLTDAAGAPLATVTAWVVPGVVRPGEKAPFGALVNEPPAGADHPVAAVAGGQTVVNLGSRYLDLAVRDAEVTIDEGQVALNGLVENVGQETASQIGLVITLYDAQQNVAGYAELLLAGPLPAGERLPFSLAVAPPGGRVTTFAITIQALK
ncbi:MAG: LysM peptidoglycan-binding domain-containing protein [Chloroflexi bacterium]|nr:LysM peptidoglycan-binding domain-containing protein [Chloroflexota bacterium]MCI0576478.1 LysM peptidoglycan-binding domain-containing protein [Chloroflexota bacterium]MCI0649546.1 LysM peptidoglycan-binding domain-containing protein [Chloroflexota bacterium]MCI0729378.1 LysM peptidoglycan-binding domain-containing protein [Chloroflexota bacterium]